MTKRTLLLTLILLLIGFNFGCVDVSPKTVDSITPPPPPSTEGPVASAVPSKTPEITPQPTEPSGPDATETRDACGNIIYGSDHYERYITFKDILVYEEDGGTFVDLKAENAYPELLLCAVNITFYSADGGIIASGSLQMPDGSFLLALDNGTTSLYARVLTDTLLTDKNFELTFDASTGVKPNS